MGLAHSPRIVTDGLVLCLDAANVKSYPGSGSTLNDLSITRNNGTLLNGIGFNSDNGGIFTFDGVDDYIGSFPVQLFGTGSRTISVWFKTSVTTRVTLIEVRDNSNEAGWGFTVNRATAGNLTYFNIDPVSSVLQVAAGILTNKWYNSVAVFDASNLSASLYLNGKFIGTSGANGFTKDNLLTGYNGSIGKPDSVSTPTYFAGNMAAISIHNRALTAEEIQQNFNALRGRFGI